MTLIPVLEICVPDFYLGGYLEKLLSRRGDKRGGNKQIRSTRPDFRISIYDWISLYQRAHAREILIANHLSGFKGL
jgi:hypothetical protein